MMRGLRPLAALAALAWAGTAGADEPPAGAADEPPPGMIEVPTPYPTGNCCVVVDKKVDEHPSSPLLQGHVGVAYRRAFREDFAAAHAELEFGGQDDILGLGARLSFELGGTRVGLPYETIGIAFAMNFHVTPRLQVTLAPTFGFFMYQRVSASKASDPTVWAPKIGGDATIGYDLVRTRRDGALFAMLRIGYDWIYNRAGDADTGSSLVLTAALGYRY